jgi:hypothetical protein
MRYVVIAVDRRTGTPRAVSAAAAASRDGALTDLDERIASGELSADDEYLLVDLDAVPPVLVRTVASPPPAESVEPPATEAVEAVEAVERLESGPEDLMPVPVLEPEELLGTPEPDPLAPREPMSAIEMEDPVIAAMLSESHEEVASEGPEITPEILFSAQTDDATSRMLLDMQAAGADIWPWEQPEEDGDAPAAPEVEAAPEAATEEAVEEPGADEPEGVEPEPEEATEDETFVPRPVIMGDYGADTVESTEPETPEPGEPEPASEESDALAEAPSEEAVSDSEGAEVEPAPEPEPEPEGDPEPEPEPADEGLPTHESMTDTRLLEPPAEDAPAYEPIETDMSLYTCDDCVYVETCPKKDTDSPATCGLFMWRS